MRLAASTGRCILIVSDDTRFLQMVAPDILYCCDGTIKHFKGPLLAFYKHVMKAQAFLAVEPKVQLWKLAEPELQVSEAGAGGTL